MKTASIEVRQENGKVYVRGSYPELSPHIYKLRRQYGMDFDRAAKEWWVDETKLSPVKLRNLKKMIGFSESGSPAIDESEVEKSLLAVLARFPNFKNFDVSVRGGEVRISGSTYPLMNDIKRAGFDWFGGERAYRAPYKNIKMDAFTDMLKEIAAHDESLIQKKQKAVQDAEKKLSATITEAMKWNRHTWAGGQLEMTALKTGLSIRSGDREFRDMIKGSFPRARWENGKWYVPYENTDKDEIQSFVKGAQSKDAALQKELSDGKSGALYKFSVGEGYGGRERAKGEVLHNTKNPARPEWMVVVKQEKTYFKDDGMSFGVGDEEGYLYTYYCREARPEEYAHILKEKEGRLSKTESLKKLKQICDLIYDKGIFPPHGTKFPSGKEYEVERVTGYGAGGYIVIQPDKIWYIKLNGADGDDWTRNNVGNSIATYVAYNKDVAKDIELLAEAADLKAK